MQVQILDIKGNSTKKKVELSDDIFNVEPNNHAIWLDIRSIRANQRQGSHDSKSRSEVSGGGKKPFRQKGTGRARQGTIRAPQYVGGGTVFGPHPRKYDIRINKKIKILARKSALSYKAKTNDLYVVENFSLDKPGTNKINELINALDLNKKSVLLLTDKNDLAIYQSARNLYKIEVRDSISFSTYDIMRAEKIIFQEGALAKVNEVLGKWKKRSKS
jgi:large subunit ribosomal protein L4